MHANDYVSLKINISLAAIKLTRPYYVTNLKWKDICQSLYFAKQEDYI